jgi:hypothetical protein
MLSLDAPIELVDADANVERLPREAREAKRPPDTAANVARRRIEHLDYVDALSLTAEEASSSMNCRP